MSVRLWQFGLNSKTPGVNSEDPASDRLDSRKINLQLIVPCRALQITGFTNAFSAALNQDNTRSYKQNGRVKFTERAMEEVGPSEHGSVWALNAPAFLFLACPSQRS
jgi:hypothetical protein